MGEKTNAATNARNLPPLPACWVIKLCKDDWPDACEIALFHTSELWLEVLPGDNPDLSSASAGSQLAVIRDRTTGIGKDRTLHWEVVVVDPRLQDVLAESNEEPASKRQRQLTHELSAVLAKRPALGLERSERDALAH